MRRLALTPGRAPGSGFALEIRAIEDGGALSLAPIAVLAVSDSVAPVGVALPGTFAVQLKQRSLLGLQLLSVAGVLERLNREAGDVMQSHWFAYADRALNNPFFLRSLALQKLGMPGPDDPPVRHFPYIDDLGRLASLLSLPPWQEPIVQDGGGAADPETVETYRQRIARIVALYTNGLGTVDAMRRMTEAQLPVDVDAIPEQQDRPFSVEEFAALTTATLAVDLPGQPTDFVGPLMHWPVVERRAAAGGADRLRHLAERGRARPGRRRRRPRLRRDGLAAARALPRRRAADRGRLPGHRPPGQDAADPAGARLVARGRRGHRHRSTGPGEDPTAPGPWKAAKGGPGGPVAAPC